MNDSTKIPDDVLARFHQNFRKVLNFASLTLTCFASKGEIVGIKLFPGTLYLRNKALVALQDSETFIKSLQSSNELKADQQLQNFFVEAIRSYESTLALSLKLMGDLENRPTN